MPSVASSFLFICFSLYFPDCSSDFDETFYTLFGLSIGQTASTIFYFHISFYSESSPCWDRVGFFIHQFMLWTSHVFIPIAVNIFATIAILLMATLCCTSVVNITNKKRREDQVHPAPLVLSNLVVKCKSLQLTSLFVLSG